MIVWWLELPVHVSVLLRFTASDCPFGIFKLFLSPASNYKPHVRHPIGRTMFTLVLFVCLMVLHATFNNISVISWRQLYWWKKPEDPEKTIDLSQVTDQLYHIMLYTSS
jgi:hypothetical protein